MIQPEWAFVFFWLRLPATGRSPKPEHGCPQKRFKGSVIEKDGALVYADPEQAQVAVTGKGAVTPIGVNTWEAQFSDARPIEVQDASVAGVPLPDENRGFFNRHPSRFDQSRRLGGRSHFVPDPAR